MNLNSKIYIAGHKGLVGSSIHRKLLELGFSNIIVESSKKLDLRNLSQVEEFFKNEQPEYVFLSAAKVGGINANASYPVQFILDNLNIQNNVISMCHKYEVKKLLFLGSSCIYPKYCEQPMKEEHLLSDKLEPTNEAYALAKIAGLKLCEYYGRQYGSNFISAMPCNIYGINDNFDPNHSHVMAALIKKFHEAKFNKQDVILWGDGTARREFLFSDDLAEGLLFLMDNFDFNEKMPFVNIGSGVDYTIKELAEIVSKIIGYEGNIIWDTTKPNGTPKKLMDNSKILSMGWKPKISIENGIYYEYLDFMRRMNIPKHWR